MSPARWLVAAAASLVVLFAVSLPEPASAQTRVKSARLCLIDLDRASTAERYAAFFDGLSALGYVEGRTLTIDWQSADGAPERFPALARECVRLQPDVIVVQTTPAAVAAKQATPAIPIVMIGSGDPVGSGLVESLARPASNVTGLSFMAPELAGKRLELLKEAVPGLARVLLLSYPVDPIDAGQIRQVERTAATLGVSVVKREIRQPADFARVFDDPDVARTEGLLLPVESIFFIHRRDVLAQAQKNRWPGVFPWRDYAEAGGLMSYHHRTSELARRAAGYVDRIVKGARPADLPVEQPTQFDLVVNLRTAKTLGIAIPRSILARAGELID